MSLAEQMAAWIGSALGPPSARHCLSFLFGSVARGVEKPNDCDMALVVRSDFTEWRELAAVVSRLRAAFALRFGLPLNILILREDEWDDPLPIIQRIRRGALTPIGSTPPPYPARTDSERGS